jgi:hypothetical protein
MGAIPAARRVGDCALANISESNCSPVFPEILFKALLQQGKMMPERKGNWSRP